MCCPAIDSPAGCGSNMMVMSAAAPATNPHFLMRDIDDDDVGVAP